MLNVILLLAYLSVVVSSTKRCYICDKSPSNEDCNSEANTCIAKESESCMTVVRSENGAYVINKSCKQALACHSLVRQNEEFCQKLGQPALCFSCCSGDLCNELIDMPHGAYRANSLMKGQSLSEKIDSRQHGTEFLRSNSTKRLFRLSKRANRTARPPKASPSPDTMSAKKRLNETPVGKYVSRKKLRLFKRSAGSIANPMPWKTARVRYQRRLPYDSNGDVSSGLTPDVFQSEVQTGGAFLMNSVPSISTCGLPRFDGVFLQRLGAWPSGGTLVAKVFDTFTATSGWAILVIFMKPLPQTCIISTWTANLLQDASNRQAFLFVNHPHNSDISSYPEFNVTFILEQCPPEFSARTAGVMAGFYDRSLTDGNCVWDVKTTTTSATQPPTPPFTIPPWFLLTPGQATTTKAVPKITTTAAATTTKTTTSTIAATTVPTTVMATTSVTTTSATSTCSNSPGGYTLLGPAYPSISGGLRAHAYIAITAEMLSRKQWSIKLIFDVPVDAILCWEVQVADHSADGLVFILQPLPWFDVLFHRLYFDIIVSTNATTVPIAQVHYCDGDVTAFPVNSSATGSTQPVTTAIPSGANSTSISPPLTTPQYSTTPTTVARCNGPRGLLPPVSRPALLNFTPCPLSDNLKYDYNEVLHKSILFYEAQRSGSLPQNNRVLWRGDSNLHDGCDVGVDLTGGWHDGGDNVKYGFPMAATVTILAWGMIEFAEGYKDAGEWSNALGTIKWGTDYFLKAHTAANELWGQVGDPLLDQNSWTRPEELNTPRTAYLLNETSPGSELAGETAAALAASAIVFNETDPSYSSILLMHSIQLYDFANRYRGSYESSIPNSDRFYPSVTGYGDELTWAALWLYLATGSKSYLDDAQQKIWEFALVKRPYDFSWDNKLAGIQVLLAMITKSARSRGDVENFLNHCLSGSSVPRTPGGLAFFSNFGSNSYAANAAFIALVAVAKIQPPLPNAQQYLEFARKQIHAILGDGDGGRSYVVGYGVNPPTQPYHAASSCQKWNVPFPPPCDGNAFTSPDPNPHVLYGALVGGPGASGGFQYSRKDFLNNEVTINYNAGFQSAVAGLKQFTVKNRKP